MLTKLLLLMALAGTGAGVGAGLVLAPIEEDMTDESDIPAAEHPLEEETDKHGDKGNQSGAEYVKLTNQFVVPIVERDRVAAMVVLSRSLEVEPGSQQKIYSLEPKLRDGFLRILFDHANMAGVAHLRTRDAGCAAGISSTSRGAIWVTSCTMF